MGSLASFAPFVVFALIEKLSGVLPGLACAALASLALLARDHLRGETELKVLEAGSALMFTVLTGAAVAVGGESWSLWQVRLWVDGGLLLMVLLSMALRRPFTLQHARRMVPPELARSAEFLHANIVVSGVWALAFLGLVMADGLMVVRPETATAIPVLLTLAVLAGAAWFTRRIVLAKLGRQRVGMRDVGEHLR